MKKTLKLSILALLFTVMFSCSNRNMNSENNVPEKENIDTKIEEIKTISSFEFINSYDKDVFFSEDNLNKEFKITDFLVEAYNYTKRNGECYLFCTPYDTKTSTYTCYTQIKQEDEVKTLNGKLLNKLYLDNGWDIKIYLTNPKDLRKLKIFDPGEEYVSGIIKIYPPVSEVTDLKDIKCTFKGLDESGTTIIFIDGEILD